MANSTEKKIVEAEEFVLKDEEGRISARLGNMPGEGPTLMLCDRAGTPRLMLALGSDGPVVGLADEHGKLLAALSCVDGGAVLQLHAARGDASTSLGAMETEPGLIFSDSERNLAVSISVSNGTLHVATHERGAAPAMPLISKLVH